MKKTYLVDEDEFSGKMVIICKTVEVEVDTYEPTKDELNAAIYLYRELPQKIEKRTRYEVSGYFNFQDGGENNRNNELFKWVTFDKDEANENFKQAVKFFH